MGGPIPKQFQGQGEPGDLLLEIDVEPSRIFRREGQDIVVTRDIDFTDAILGTPLRQASCPPVSGEKLMKGGTWKKKCWAHRTGSE